MSEISEIRTRQNLVGGMLTMSFYLFQKQTILSSSVERELDKHKVIALVLDLVNGTEWIK